MREMPQSGSLVGFVARHPNAANLIMVLMILFGAFSLGRINTQLFPTVEVYNVNVTVSWPGASAEDVETNILQVIEPEVRFIDNLKTLNSYAREGSGTVSLEFEPHADMQKAVSDVDSAVKAITNLPEDSESPNISRTSFFDPVARLSISGDVPEATLRSYAKKIRDDLIGRGIDKVEFSGLRAPELLVEIPESEFRRLGLSVADVSARIAGNSRDLPSGQMEGDVEKQLRAVADFKTPSALGDVEIRSFASGEKVHLGDIADIRFGFDDSEGEGYSAGGRAIQLSVQRAPTADTLATAEILNEYLGELEQSLPPGITLQKYDVASDYLVQRIWLLVKNGLGGLVLVVAMLFIFLNARIAFWVAAGIPIAMMATIGIMLVLGQTINMISLFALIMMLGIIVDDAIVVGEHTATRFSLGDDPYTAAENGAGRMLVPVLAAMTTTIAAFAPIMLIGDTIGQIMGVLPIVVIATIIASLIECFFILPGHLAHTLQPVRRRGWSHWRHLLVSLAIGVFLVAVATRSGSTDGVAPGIFEGLAKLRLEGGIPLFIAVLTVTSLAAGALVEAGLFLLSRLRDRSGMDAGSASEGPQESALRRGFDRGFAWFRDGPFDRLVRLSLSYRYLTLSIALSTLIVVVGGLYIGGGRVSFVFFPSPEAENINVNMVFNAGTPDARVREIVDRMEQSLRETEAGLTGGSERLVIAAFTTIGSSGRNRGDNLASMRVQLTSSETRTIRTPDIVKAWRRNLPELAGLRRASIQESRGGPPGRDIDIEVTGADVATLKLAATEIADMVSALPAASGISDDLPFGKPELVMSLTELGKSLGFSIEEVGRQVRNAFEGAIPRRYAMGDDEVTIRVTMTSRREGAAALRDFELRSPSGEFVPLTEVVDLAERQGFSAIRRLDGRTVVSVTADLDTEQMTTEQAMQALQEAGLTGVASRYGVSYEFGGRSEERMKAMADLQYGIFIALAVIYIVLAWVFSSYWRPVAIMLIIPFGIVGAIFGHWLLDYDLTMLSFIALLGLAGILVNDSIILVSRMDERLAEGEELHEAAAGASRDRLRAVLLTSLTTIGGLFPLLFEKSVQAQFMLPMAISIIFGLALATLLVLFLVPAIVAIGADIRWLLVSLYGERFGKAPAE